LFQEELYPNTALLATLTQGEHQNNTVPNTGTMTVVISKWGPIIGVGVAHFYLDAVEVASHDLLRRLGEETAPLIAIRTLKQRPILNSIPFPITKFCQFLM